MAWQIRYSVTTSNVCRFAECCLLYHNITTRSLLPGREECLAGGNAFMNEWSKCSCDWLVGSESTIRGHCGSRMCTLARGNQYEHALTAWQYEQTAIAFSSCYDDFICVCPVKYSRPTASWLCMIIMRLFLLLATGKQRLARQAAPLMSLALLMWADDGRRPTRRPARLWFDPARCFVGASIQHVLSSIMFCRQSRSVVMFCRHVLSSCSVVMSIRHVLSSYSVVMFCRNIQ